MYHSASFLPSHPSSLRRAVFSCWFLKPRLKPVNTALAYNRAGCGAILDVCKFKIHVTFVKLHKVLNFVRSFRSFNTLVSESTKSRSPNLLLIANICTYNVANIDEIQKLNKISCLLTSSFAGKGSKQLKVKTS